MCVCNTRPITHVRQPLDFVLQKVNLQEKQYNTIQHNTTQYNTIQLYPITQYTKYIVTCKP